MTDYGGLGGSVGGRERYTDDEFENAVERALGEKLRAEAPCDCGRFRCDHIGGRLWGTLANADFIHENGDTAGYSFRAAGDLIAAIVGSGSYIDWYCSNEYDLQDPEVLEALGSEGWRRCEPDERPDP